MKKNYLRAVGLLGLLLALGQKSFAQYVEIKTEPATARLTVESGIPSTGRVKLRIPAPNSTVLAFAPGYATQGILLQDITGSSYTITLRKSTPLPAKSEPQKLEFSKLTDRTGKLERLAISMGMYGTAPGTSMDDPTFASAITGQLSKLGYSLTGTNTIFNEAAKATDLALGAEIMAFSKDTRGPGFQVSLLVHWSLFSRLQQRILYEANTGGYSDTQVKTIFNDELARALQDAANGIGSDPAFQALLAAAAGPAATTAGATTFSPLKLTVPRRKTFGSYGEVVRAATPSTVTVKTPAGHGSGFVVSADGYILTNQHVVQNAEKIEVVFDNDFSFDASVVRSDVTQDVALLKIQGKGFKPLVLDAREEQATVGTDVVAIGTPENVLLGQSVTKGIVSGQRNINNRRYLQTDVAISPGNSGGPLINTATGAVIGIISAKIKAQGVEGIGFGIPIGEATKVLNIKIEEQ